MAYTVFFREGNEIFPATTYITRQLTAHRQTLQTVTATLAEKGFIEDPLATKTTNGGWWILLKDENGDVYTYTFFISRFEQEEIKNEQSPKKKELVIVDPAVPTGSDGNR